ncbi:hypothetical protein WMY93_015929 [Mugilogobius chulae]|uniref:Cornichon family AMPA receptor auxiliary protein 3 n=1 Tax=Mugilogobius chulae TaxID=88201 RepID=A0AAW0NSI0_9GOBI
MLSLVLCVSLIFFAIWHITAFDELQADFKVPIDQGNPLHARERLRNIERICNLLRKLVLPEYSIHGLFCVMFLCAQEWLTVGLNILCSFTTHGALEPVERSGTGSVPKAEQLLKLTRGEERRKSVLAVSLVEPEPEAQRLQMLLPAQLRNETRAAAGASELADDRVERESQTEMEQDKKKLLPRLLHDVSSLLIMPSLSVLSSPFPPLSPRPHTPSLVSYFHSPTDTKELLYDPASVMNGDTLKFCLKEAWCKLSFFVLSFFYYLYW